MCRIAVSGLVCCFLIVAEAAEAQIVQSGPEGGLRIAAPFVRVEVAPDGRTRVRAPFTAVESRAFRTPGRYEPGRAPLLRGRLQPVQETNVALMDWRTLRHHARTAASRFDGELARVAGGTTWTASLRPGTIRDLLAEDTDQPPDRATVEQLAPILQSYAALADSGGYPQIARLSGFRQTREALIELTWPPRQRAQRNLGLLWPSLHDELGQFESGATWQSYLALPVDVTDGQDAAPPSKGQLQQVEEILSRYEEVIGPEDYRAIAQLGSFRATHRHLAGYVVLLRQETSKPKGLRTLPPEGIPAPRPEGLPTPRPQELKQETSEPRGLRPLAE